MNEHDRPQLPLTDRKKAMLGVSALMFAAHVVAAIIIAPEITGEGDTNAPALFALWAASIPWAAIIVLLAVRQADLPDIATASMLVTIPVFGAFTLTAAFGVRGTDSETDLTSALFLGVTAGALTAMLVWGLATAVARALKLPTTSAS